MTANCPLCFAGDAPTLFRRVVGKQSFALVRCPGCGLHFCHPTPSKADISGFYSGDYHSQLRVPGATEAAFGAKFAGYRDWILGFMRSGRSLDIGSATGLMPALLKEAGFDAEGIEYNRDSAAWGQKHYGVRIHAGDISDLGPTLGKFDLILMTDVLEHAPHPLEFLRLVLTHLKTGGYLLVTFPDIRSFESRYCRLWSRLLQRDWIWNCCRIPRHVWEFTPATARGMFEKAGLDVTGFRRQNESDFDYRGLWRLVFAPLLPLKVPLIGNRFGSQMQFMLRKRG